MNGRTIVIGDIHGCWDELQALLDAVALAPEDAVVSVGDLVDRGPDPRSVVDWFRARPGAVVVSGNHERKHVRATMSPSQEISKLQLGPGYADDVDWMRGLPYVWENDEVIVVHAAVVPGEPVATTPEDILCGTTSGEEKLRKRLGAGWWHEQYAGSKPVVFGHHVVDAPLVREGLVYGIDTGACHGGQLTALVLPSFELVSVPARADHWRATRKAWGVALARARPWDTYAFEQLERKAADLARGAEPAVIRYLDALVAWSRALRERIPGLAVLVDDRVAAIRAAAGDGFGAAAAADPAGPTLLQRARGRLSDTHLGCSTPADVIHLARALGASDLPAPP